MHHKLSYRVSNAYYNVPAYRKNKLGIGPIEVVLYQPKSGLEGINKLNENARVVHLPQVHGVQNSPNNFDVNL